MTDKQLKKVALIHFALHGYEGGSLALIAKEVGIKKPSIYTHFKSKDELFISTFNDAVECEILFIKKFFSENKTKPLKTTLFIFLNKYLDNCKNERNTSFFLRTSFFPPVQLEKITKKGTDKYIFELEYIFKTLFYQKSDVLNSNVNPKTATVAFITMLNGLLAEQLYGDPERLDERISESWSVFWQGISTEIYW
ncbi:TetR/AcrR family transcriptional regulator [Bacillus sp. CRN 9]|nr:TetR/AcrR family transcriptional regulator [Bacillus sp. CRN 9]